MKPIVLTSAQRKEMERRRKKTLDRRVYQRLTAVLAVAASHTPEEVAHFLGGICLARPAQTDPGSAAWVVPVRPAPRL
jgi:hypothetical protein